MHAPSHPATATHTSPPTPSTPLRLQELEEESLRDNFVIVYELLDEVMDFGYPQFTEAKILSECVGSQQQQWRNALRSSPRRTTWRTTHTTHLAVLGGGVSMCWDCDCVHACTCACTHAWSGVGKQQCAVAGTGLHSCTHDSSTAARMPATCVHACAYNPTHIRPPTTHLRYYTYVNTHTQPHTHTVPDIAFALTAWACSHYARYIKTDAYKMEVGVKPPMAVTNAVSWRMEGIRHKKNEVGRHGVCMCVHACIGGCTHHMCFWYCVCICVCSHAYNSAAHSSIGCTLCL